MARNSSGTYSTPAGQPVVSGTTIDSTVFNNLVSDLSAEITDSASRSGKGGFTAPVRAADGTAAAPAHSFTSDTDNGLYRKGANNPAMSAAGGLRQEWTSTGSIVTGTLEVTGGLTLGGAMATALNMNTHAINGVVDPSGAQDAATKNYVDVTAGASAATASALMRRDANGRAKVAEPSALDDIATLNSVVALSNGTASISWASNWAGTTGAPSNQSSKVLKTATGLVVLQLSAKASAGAGTTIGTLPAGYRPSSGHNAHVITWADPAGTLMHAEIQTGGAIVLASSPTAGQIYYATVTYSTD